MSAITIMTHCFNLGFAWLQSLAGHRTVVCKRWYGCYNLISAEEMHNLEYHISVKRSNLNLFYQVSFSVFLVACIDLNGY
ncbi:hypothetical protein KSP40_PGU004382 [Platanthera guangdongensis]|uniref:Uncharacterized protein n=1 Tax=Platanthera guangdongensis TaxID=2320717 RepID=A0ABR2N501_9ASPA